MKKQMAIACAMFAAVSGAVTIDSTYKIVVPDYEKSGIPAELSRAANKLQQALEEGAGLKLKTVSLGKSNGGKAIYIGAEAARRAGLMPSSGMRDFSNIVAEKGGSVYLFGHDRALYKSVGCNTAQRVPIPTLKAIARFMEDFLQVRFLAPGDVGTDIPKIEKVEVPDGLFSRQDPTLEYSRANLGTPLFNYASGIFGNGRYYSYGGHTYPKACPPSKYFKDHPEYFGLVGGIRIGSNEKNSTLCISNPEVQELLVNELKARFNDGADVVQLAQQDGWQFCECEECKRFGGPEAEYIGEKIWILHRNIAERLLKECPGKTVHILCYSATLKPPKTFRKFPANVMIELCHVSPQQIEEWKGYEVPKGFTAYIYLWGSYQPLGFTPKRSWMRCYDFAKLLVDSGIHGVYRCGYGEMYGMEGPAYWIFNKAMQDVSIDVDKAIDEYCERAYGPQCAKAMRKFHEAYDCRLRGINLMEGDMDAGAIRPTDSWRDTQVIASLDLLAFVYSPDVLKTMESYLSYAERHADTPKRKKRLELVRTEFGYVKNLARLATLYAAFRTSPSRNTLNPLLDVLDEREKILDSICTENHGRARHFDGWPEILLFNGAPRDFLLTNGRLLATLSSPVGWDTKILRETNVLPGAYRKSYSVARTEKDPSAVDPDDASWSAAEWTDLAGMQMEKVKAKARFKLLAGAAAFHIVVESDLPKEAPLDSYKRDGKVWRNENVDILLAAGDYTDRRFHFIIGPLDGSLLDSRYGFVKDPLDPYFRKDDERWNGDVAITNTRNGDKWIMYAKIPYATLATSAPKAGAAWRINVGRDTNKQSRPYKPVQMLWNPNLQSRSFVSPDAMGRLVFK